MFYEIKDLFEYPLSGCHRFISWANKVFKTTWRLHDNVKKDEGPFVSPTSFLSAWPPDWSPPLALPQLPYSSPQTSIHIPNPHPLALPWQPRPHWKLDVIPVRRAEFMDVAQNSVVMLYPEKIMCACVIEINGQVSLCISSIIMAP